MDEDMDKTVAESDSTSLAHEIEVQVLDQTKPNSVNDEKLSNMSQRSQSRENLLNNVEQRKPDHALSGISQ